MRKMGYYLLVTKMGYYICRFQNKIKDKSGFQLKPCFQLPTFIPDITYKKCETKQTEGCWPYLNTRRKTLTTDIHGHER